jgi:prepilin-type processing-associated H-X9-DG protein
MVVVSIIAMLAAMLVPAVVAAREMARSSACKSNLKNIGSGLVIYQTSNDGYVVPSYNMIGTSSPTDPNLALDGWAAIMDHEGDVGASRSNTNNIYGCPDMSDIDGWLAGNTGATDATATGYMEWPSYSTGAKNVATTIPTRGYNKIIRVGYWINADNPIGTTKTVVPNVYYTSSVGYGTGTTGLMIPTRSTAFTKPSELLVLADGIYAGRQAQSRLGDQYHRIGYRHKGLGAQTRTNVAYADGHADSIDSSAMPRAKTDDAYLGDVTFYADPMRARANGW